MGFHSLVRVLLEQGEFESREMEQALEKACVWGFHPIARLLVEHGAPMANLWFSSVASRIDRDFIGFMLERGADPGMGDEFAYVCRRTKAKPLLGVYRDYRERFPVLEEQMALAMIDCIEKNDEKGFLLTRWAGVDPFLKVREWSRDDPKEEEEEESWQRCAASEAVICERQKFLELLQIRPDTSQLRALLERSPWRANADILTYLISLCPDGPSGVPALLNDRADGTCRILSCALSRYHGWFGRNPGPEQDACFAYMTVLLANGARWGVDDTVTIDRIRRALYHNEASYAARVLRLLWDHPDLCPREMTRELADKPKMRGLLKLHDKKLMGEMKG
jgi:hypothetical protein